jgi:hypothetical protein
MAIGFDNDKYLSMQSEHIEQRSFARLSSIILGITCFSFSSEVKIFGLK